MEEKTILKETRYKKLVVKEGVDEVEFLLKAKKTTTAKIVLASSLVFSMIFSVGFNDFITMLILTPIMMLAFFLLAFVYHSGEKEEEEKKKVVLNRMNNSLTYLGTTYPSSSLVDITINRYHMRFGDKIKNIVLMHEGKERELRNHALTPVILTELSNYATVKVHNITVDDIPRDALRTNSHYILKIIEEDQVTTIKESINYSSALRYHGKLFLGLLLSTLVILWLIMQFTGLAADPAIISTMKIVPTLILLMFIMVIYMSIKPSGGIISLTWDNNNREISYGGVSWTINNTARIFVRNFTDHETNYIDARIVDDEIINLPFLNSVDNFREMIQILADKMMIEMEEI